MRKLFLAFVAVFLLVCVIFVFFGVRDNLIARKYTQTVFPLPENYAELPILPSQAGYLFNPDDKYLMTGYSDLVLLATVTGITGTTYEKVEVEFGAVTGTPYTCYRFIGHYNIKGRLKTETEIPLKQYGGVLPDQKARAGFSPMLEADRSYVLYLRVGPDDTLFLNQAIALAADLREVRAEDLLADPDDPTGQYIAACIEAYRHEDTTYAPVKRNSSSYEESEAGA